VTRIPKLSACGFEIDSDYVRNSAFTFSESNAIKHNFTENKANGRIPLAKKIQKA
jgi:hypothetical protein